MSVERNLQSPVSHLSENERTSGKEQLDGLARLSGGIAHDVNNILHIVKNATEMLRQKSSLADPETARVVDMLSRTVDRGRQLTLRLLAFAGRQPLEPVAVNANRVIADMQQRLRESFGRNLQIESALEGSLWQTKADPAELEAAILGLAENARDAMPGGGKVMIETMNVTMTDTPGMPDCIPEGEYVSIAVRDHGTGMSKETVARAFDPYYTTKEAGFTTGLGLSRVYGFVRQTGGHIAVESKLGFGTTVKLYLPRMRYERTEGERREQNDVPLNGKPKRAGGAKRLAGLRVLVVEDEFLIGMLAEDLLEQLGCQMIGLVSSISRASETAKTAEIDFALLDVDIGGEPVYPVALTLEARGVPFVFMSGYGELADPWRGRPIVQKPFNLEQLKTEMERALNVGSPPM